MPSCSGLLTTENLYSVRECPAGTARQQPLARISGARVGVSVLPAAPGRGGGQPGHSSRPAEHAAATCQAVTGPRTPTVPQRPVAAAVAASTSRCGRRTATGVELADSRHNRRAHQQIVGVVENLSWLDMPDASGWSYSARVAVRLSPNR